ncbi:ThuA domain-containing protein [Zhouia spongiae]|uniref:ThuA domain-containing protein n=1 Tax=Zhouia spongiae TaxID=2202721 RepID=A0ABY3YPP7_9FLAO|nr:ThuA domain-containing protein [Zhouia spongiae]UNY99595.1 ThuA domain-containing protein [Zhouia spongiae]
MRILLFYVLPFFFFFNLITGQEYEKNEENVLLFTKTAGFRHQSIEDGAALIKRLGKENDFNVIHSEDSSIFNDDSLKNIDLIIFLSTTGDILNSEQEKAFKKFIHDKKAFLGVHAATDTEFEWEWYGKLVGAYFDNHPKTQTARLEVLDTSHPSCSHLPEVWNRTDEWYNFRDINPAIKVLINLDEMSYEGGKNGAEHPIAWFHLYKGSRVFYTGGGHTKESYKEKNFIRHLLGGVLWCLKRSKTIE